MRCKYCGGFLEHTVTSTNGKTFYQYRTALTSMREETGVFDMTYCELIYDQAGRVVNDSIFYLDGDKVHTLRVVDGVPQRVKGKG